MICCYAFKHPDFALFAYARTASKIQVCKNILIRQVFFNFEVQLDFE